MSYDDVIDRPISVGKSVTETEERNKTETAGKSIPQVEKVLYQL